MLASDSPPTPRIAYFRHRLPAARQASDIVKLELFDRAEPFRAISAIVLKSSSNGDVQIEFGPADGAPNLRILMSQDEAYELGAALHGLDGEKVILVDD